MRLASSPRRYQWLRMCTAAGMKAASTMARGRRAASSDGADHEADTTALAEPAAIIMAGR
jgi:hypothetical protein